MSPDRGAPAPPADVAVIGGGAAGLMAAIHAGRARPGRRVRILDGARRIGAKILVSGGGRCNVTHDTVDAASFAGSRPAAIRKVLRRLDIPETVRFFEEIGVRLKREESGKLFPVTDDARTVLRALLDAAASAGVEVVTGRRVDAVRPVEGGFLLEGPAGGWGAERAREVILATGGRSLPRTGSDGHGYAIAQSLGHTVTARILPALVPLTLADGSFLRDLAGVSARVEVEVRSATGRRLAEFAGDALCAHFGITGPAILDASRHYLHAREDDPGAHLVIRWIPGATRESLDAALRDLGAASPGRWLQRRLPQRLARAICDHAGVEPSAPGSRLSREARRALVEALAAMRLPVTGDRGFAHAEVTAGGIPLSEIRLETMRSRIRPGLLLCGEICDVDGRIGGYNFQWAWASGYVAGVSVG